MVVVEVLCGYLSAICKWKREMEAESWSSAAPESEGKREMEADDDLEGKKRWRRERWKGKRRWSESEKLNDGDGAIELVLYDDESEGKREMEADDDWKGNKRWRQSDGRENGDGVRVRSLTLVVD
ncbi:hypothetical protein Dimus_004921 [Dionaea muscipula]